MSTAESKPHYLEHRKRIKSQFVNESSAGWDDYRVLELMLCYALPRQDTKGIAKDLMQQFGSFASVLDASQEELLEVKGIGKHAAILIQLFRDVSIRYAKAGVTHTNVLSNPQAVVDYLRTVLKGKSHEEVRALFLNTANQLIAEETISEGTINEAPLYPRQMVELVIKHKAASVVISHNHPGGNTRPSPADREITKAIKDALQTIDVRLLDHIIVTPTSYTSFQEQGWL